MNVNLFILEGNMASQSLVGTPEFKLVQHRSVQLMDSPRFVGEGASFVAPHILLLSALITNDILAVLTLHRIYN